MIRARRRSILALAGAACAVALAAASTLASTPASAQAFPNRPVRFVIGFPAGSAGDLTFRPVAEAMTRTLGQNVVMEYRPGGGGMVQALYVKSQPADGYTFALASNSLVGASLRQGSEIDIRRDFTPIATASAAPLFIAVNADQVKAGTLKEFLDEVRAKPGQMNYASNGVGSSGHVFMELLLSETKLQMVHVPYQGGGPATADTASGRTVTTTTSLAALRPFVASLGGSGKLRILAATTAERSSLLPEVPGMREAGLPQIDFPTWAGFVGPRGMPRNVVDVLGRAIGDVYKDPKITEVLARLGVVPVNGGPEDLARIISREYDATAKLIRENGLKLE
jgi:tripartite-type tricarboxylate transporter receptor subunit TctC